MREWRATLSFSCEHFIVPRLCIREINVSDYNNKLRTSFLSLHDYISKSILTLDNSNKLKKFLRYRRYHSRAINSIVASNANCDEHVMWTLSLRIYPEMFLNRGTKDFYQVPLRIFVI